MVQEVTTTLKVHLVTSDSDKEALAEVSEAYRAACNYISDYVFESGDESVGSLHERFYYELRSRFGLKSQLAESAVKTVLAKYATVHSNGQKRTRVRFRVPQCDLVRGRDWSYTRGKLSVNTLRGRLKLSFHIFLFEGRKPAGGLPFFKKKETMPFRSKTDDAKLSRPLGELRQSHSEFCGDRVLF